MHSKPYLFSISSHPNAIHVNSLSIKLLQPNIDFSPYKYLILTSKQAVKALKQYNKKDYIGKKALCISKATAKSYEDIGGKVLKVGSGYGDTLKEAIFSYPKETKWLYLRAKIIASDFTSLCNDRGYNIDEVVVYESDCSEDILNIKVKKDDTLIFTSPSSVHCFLKNSSIMKSNKVIVIGKSTAKALPKDIAYTLSNETTIESCMKILDLD